MSNAGGGNQAQWNGYGNVKVKAEKGHAINHKIGLRFTELQRI